MTKKGKSLSLVCFVILVMIGVVLIYRSITKEKELETIMLHADYPYYNNLDELVDHADTIITGKIVKYQYEILMFLETYRTVPASLLNVSQANYELNEYGEPATMDKRIKENQDKLEFSIKELESIIGR